MVVVGAGSAGLAAAAALRRRGVEVVVLERGPSVATSWRGRHEELRLNTIRWLSDLPGLRMPRSLGRWVTRDDYVDYLEGFAQHQGLDIRFDVHVDRLDPSPGGWHVATSAGDHETDQVVVATGYDHVPWVPDWPGRDQFPKPVMHVAEHRRAADLAGLQVLLVGAGNSGVEIAGHLVDGGVGALWVSVRTPPNLLPREVGGLPLHPLSRWLRILPERLRDANARIIARLAFGDLARHGLPAPSQGPYERLRTTGVTVAVDQGFVRHLKAGHLEIVAEVDRFAGPEVVLHDGRRLRPDIVLAATGFRRGLERLAGHLDVLDRAGLPQGGPGMPTPGAPGLWFIGYRTAIEGNLRQHPIEARRIADAITRARSKAPSRFRLRPRRADHGGDPIPHGDPPAHRDSQPALPVPGQGRRPGHATAARRAQPVTSRAARLVAARPATSIPQPDPAIPRRNQFPAASPTRTALVTGASSGLGGEFANQLASRKYDLVLVARSADRLHRLAEDIRTTYDVHADVIMQDLAAPDAARRISAELATQGRTVDLLINNAGFGTAGRFEEISPSRDHDQLMVNVVALADLTHELVPAMLDGGHGAVVNVGSTAGFQPAPYFAAYSAAKAFVLNFSLALHAEYHCRGVRVLALMPGPIDTAFFDTVGTQAAIGGRLMKPDAVVRAALRALDRDRAYAVPGIGNKLSAHLTPRRPCRLVAAISKRVTRKVLDAPAPSVASEPNQRRAA